MPTTPLHTLTWSQDHLRYALATQGQPVQMFAPEDTDAWHTWLATATSFTFRGVAGRLNVYHEARGETTHYWYAYQTTGKRTRKRYLGQSARVTFARLEEVALALAQRVSVAEQDPTEPSAMPGIPLLSTSLVPLRLRADLVVRAHLLARLDAACAHRLTLLAASAGWGKTTLLSMWAARSRLPVAWLSLDGLDNDPTRFWVAVIAALRHSGAASPLVGERSLTLLRSPQPPSLDTILGMLVNDLSGQSTPTFLLLDDYQVIEEQAIHDSVLFLLEHLPVHLHLVLASRTDPPLPLARLRSRGALLELRDADLRFQEAEVDQFLAQTMALALDPTEVALLGQRTEGWIAGLHLAALALAHHEDHSTFLHGFAGSHRYLMDYVQEEILAHVEQPLQDFLFHSAILTRLSAPLCQAVTAQADLQTCQQMLESLERANLFLVPLDEERRWYRLHDLFREALLARLHATWPELVPLLHRRAASFYERHGEWSEAITHRLAAQDYTAAVAVMEHTVEQFWLHGETATLFHWLTGLPDEAIRTHASFVLKVAGYLLNASAYTPKAQLDLVRAQIERLLVRVEEVVPWAEGAQQDQLRLLRQRLSLLRLIGEVQALVADSGMQHDRARYTFLVQQIMRMDQDDEIFWQVMSLAYAFVYSFAFLQEGAGLLPRLLEARQQAIQSGERFALLKIKQWVALTALQAGQLRLAHRESLEALAFIEHIQGYALLKGYFLLCLADVFSAWNQLDEARQRLDQVIEDATAWRQIDMLEWAYGTLAELEVAAGNLATAEQVLHEALCRLPRGGGNFAFIRTCIQVRLWLAQGNLAEANAWAARVVFRHVDTNPIQREGVMALILVSLAGQQYDQALAVMEAFRASLDRPGNILNTISFLSFYATALHQAGRCAQAREAVLRLLSLTEPEGYLRVYLDMGKPMQQLLQSLLDEPQELDEAASPVPGASISTLLAAFAEEKQQRARRLSPPANTWEQASQVPSPTSLPGSVSAQPGLLEPLTAQEQRVLRLLAAGRSTQEMAQALVVSRNTVKTHLRNLYSKLQANSRTQALALARDLQLL